METPRLRLALAFSMAALLLLAWQHRFIQDDAFISFRYAENFAAGKGLVWNEGERVEGYTNFLWTILMAIPFRLGLEPIAFSYALGLASFLVTLAITFRLARQLVGSEWSALATLILLGTNFTFSSYATGGLETQLQTALHVVTVWLAVAGGAEHGASVRRAALLSLVAAAAVLTRLDSVLVAGPALLVAGFRLTQRPGRVRLRALAALALPFLVVVGSWFVWKVRFYGDLLPNTYYAKVASGTSLASGLLYLYAFAVSYWLPAFVLLVLAALPALLKLNGGALLLAVSLLWCGYVASVGGDFMEFRFLVPVLPFLMILFVAAGFALVPGRALRVVLVALVALGSLNHAVTFMDLNLPYEVYRVESIAHLQDHISDPDSNWIAVGQALAREFPEGQVVIAVNAAGAVPFYSRLPSIDMRGLTDKWVARHGRVTGDRPGHQRIATAAYLVKRGVNLVVGHPELRLRDDPKQPSLDDSNFLRFGGPLPARARLVEIPVDAEHTLLCVYLVPSPLVERAIEARGFRTWPMN